MFNSKHSKSTLSAVNELPEARRKVVKSAVVGGVAIGISSQIMPSNWAKPVVESIVLPSHAMTTNVSSEANTTEPPVVTPNPCPDGPVASCTADTIPRSLFFSTPNFRASGRVENLTASVCPAEEGVTVSLSAVVNNINVSGVTATAVPSQTQSTTNSQGIASFSEISTSVTVPGNTSASSISYDVDVTFSANGGSRTCTASFLHSVPN